MISPKHQATRAKRTIIKRIARAEVLAGRPLTPLAEQWPARLPPLLRTQKRNSDSPRPLNSETDVRRQGRINTVLAATAALAISAEATATDFSDDLLWSSQPGDIPHVLTPVRLQQPTAEVPASVTVIDRDFMDTIGTKEVYELLRYVPGMLVAPEPLNNSVNVAYHGGPAIIPKSMEVLIDGRAIYRSGISGVAWASLPVAVEDIQRIEIVRGPNSTAYGTNAYKAVINIITIHPSDTAGENKVSGYLGNTGYQS